MHIVQSRRAFLAALSAAGAAGAGISVREGRP
ncbi:MAG: twin-arginine translocation signal domain-containing protein [Tardiphaga sp.]